MRDVASKWFYQFQLLGAYLVKPDKTVNAGDAALAISGVAVKVGADRNATMVDADGKPPS